MGLISKLDGLIRLEEHEKIAQCARFFTTDLKKN